MIRLRENKLFRFATFLLLACLSASALHFLTHAAQHDEHSVQTDHCAICQFVTVIGAILLCVFILFFKLQKASFDFPETTKRLPLESLSAAAGRAPPFVLS